MRARNRICAAEYLIEPRHDNTCKEKILST